MASCTGSSYNVLVNQQELYDKGLSDGHAYTLVGAKIVIPDDQIEVRLVKIRNPFGFKEWKGDWSDHSKKWTTRLRAQVNGENKEDGVFFMTFEDFIKFFTRTTICFYQDDYEDNFICD